MSQAHSQMSTAHLRETSNDPSRQSTLHRYRYTVSPIAHTPQLIIFIRSEMLREPFAEFLGVAILIIFGAGVNCQVLLSSVSGVSSSPKGVRTVCRIAPSQV
jgi:aquaglyceroporin related protein